MHLRHLPKTNDDNDNDNYTYEKKKQDSPLEVETPQLPSASSDEA